MATESDGVEVRMVPAGDVPPQQRLFELRHPERATLKTIPIVLIDVPDSESFDRQELRDLADNIRRTVLINKPTVLKRPGGRFEAMVGRRRLAAMQLLATIDPSVTVVDCYVRDARTTNDEDIATLVLSENARRSANVLAELDSINVLSGPPRRMSAAQIAKSVGQNVAWVNRRKSLNQLRTFLLHQMRRGRVKFDTAIQVAKRDADQQKRIEAAFRAKLKGDPDAVLSSKDVDAATSCDTVELPQEMFAELPPVDPRRTPMQRLQTVRHELEDVAESLKGLTADAVQVVIDKLDVAIGEINEVEP